MRDKKHRITSTIITIISLILALLIYFLISEKATNEVGAISAFALGILIIIIYQTFNLKHLEHDKTKLNSLTQVWLGIILIIASIIVLILNVIFKVEFTTALLWMVGIVLVIMFLTIKKFDQYIMKKHNIS